MQLFTPNINNDHINMYGEGPDFNSNNIFETWVQHGPSQHMADEWMMKNQAYLSL
ncbi:hypothetical protein [Chitinophaga caseinilytica]|uniref:hypothetical protein n=1 Tax=Chitinophaga caseinilytica TaxID=2267521 RepID=UPI003C2D0400